jgi:uncharacterized protein YcfJ
MSNEFDIRQGFGMLIITVSGLLAGCDSATGNYGGDNSQDYANVTSLKAVTKTVEVPREECRDEVVTQTREARDPDKIVGTVAGAVIGGVIGNQIGSGTGRDVATIGGAVVGGYAGNQVQEGMQERNIYQEVRRNCATIFDSREEVDGYEVTYSLNGVQRTIHLDYDPGERIDVENGVLVIRN